MRLLTIVACLSLLGCGTRRPVPRATPAVTTVFVTFEQLTLDMSEMAKMGGALGSMLSMANAMGGMDALNANHAPQLEASVRRAMVDTRVAIPVLDRAAADLVLRGTVGPDAAMMQWQLSDAHGTAVVSAGSERSKRGADAVEIYADQIMRDLLKSTIDQYAGRAKSAPQVAKSPVPATPAGISAPPAKTDGSQSFAVIIGVETYRDDLPVATHAEADARAFAAYAQKTLGVPETHIKLLIGERAGRADIQSMFQEWLPRNAVNPKGKVYVFFSGHGAPDPQTGDTYLVPWDADPAYIKTRGVAVRDLYAALNALPNQQAYVFLDACFSGSGQRSVIAQGTRPLVPVKSISVAGRTVALTASAAAETTGAARDAQHGLFTRHLLAALGGAADENGDADISLQELATYVRNKVTREARLDNRDQTPSLIVGDGIEPKSHVLVDGLWK